jgi:peptidoglycan/xylan/chitin deacetylase (PgdA/CDA1 family)
MFRFKLILLTLLTISPLFGDSHIFLLHRFDDVRYESTNISTSKLREHFKNLEIDGYKIVSLEYLLSNPEEDKLVSFTIDDGYKSFFESGLDLFREFNYPFTLFIYTEAIDKAYPDFMNWTQVKRASQFGEIAIHSHKHPHLTHLDPISIMKDTQESISTFKDNMGEPPKYYAYPYGEFDKSSKEIIEAFGFSAIFNQSMGAFNKESDKYNIYRTSLNNSDDLKLPLSIKFLKVEWFEPFEYPEDNLLRKVIAKVPNDIQKVLVYISGGSWVEVNVENGIVHYEPNQPFELKLKQSRIFIKTYDNRWGSHIIVK